MTRDRFGSGVAEDGPCEPSDGLRFPTAFADGAVGGAVVAEEGLGCEGTTGPTLSSAGGEGKVVVDDGATEAGGAGANVETGTIPETVTVGTGAGDGDTIVADADVANCATGAESAAGDGDGG